MGLDWRALVHARGFVLRGLCAMIGVMVLTAGVAASPHPRTWADVEVRRSALRAQRRRAPDRPAVASPLCNVRAGAWAAGPVLQVVPLTPSSWRVVVRLASGDAWVRVRRGVAAGGDAAAPGFTLTAEPSLAPLEDVRTVARVLAVSLTTPTPCTPE